MSWEEAEKKTPGAIAYGVAVFLAVLGAGIACGFLVQFGLKIWGGGE